MKKVTVIFITLIVAASTAARTITVDNDGPADFNNIQAAINDANDGDTVMVADGTYTGDGNRDIDFHGKAITVKSENGPQHCIISCQATFENMHRGFHFNGGEGPDSIVSGFTVTSGGALAGGGIVCTGSSPTIENNIIIGNTAYSDGVRTRGLGGGIYCYSSSAVIVGNLITANVAEGEGGAISATLSSLLLVNNRVTANHAQATGGSCSSAGRGGAIRCFRSSLTTANCTILGNEAHDLYSATGEDPGEGGAIWHSYSSLTLVNSILRTNKPDQFYSDFGSNTIHVTYSNIEGGWSGEGNIDTDPCFADPNNADYHLKSQGGRRDQNEGLWVTDDVTSPCIDAGDPTDSVGREPFPNGGRINIGAYCGTAEASKSYFNKPPCETIVAGDINGDCEINFEDFRLMALHWMEDRTPLADIQEFYYYSDGGKVFINIFTDYFAVCFREGVSEDEIQALTDHDPVLNCILSYLFEGLVVFNTKIGTTESDIIKATQRFERLSQVKYASPVFGDYKSWILLTDEFIAKFHPDVTQDEIEELNSLHDVEIIRYPDKRDSYLLRVKDPTSFKTLTTANIYYESPLTEYALPNFVLYGLLP